MATSATLRRHAWWALAGGLALLAATSALPRVHFRTHGGGGDVALYESYATKLLDGSLPYHGFFFEYPPLSLVAMVAPKATGLDYAVSLRVLMWVCMAVSLGAVLATLVRLGARPVRLWGAAVLIGAAPALLGPILFERFDAWPAALLAVSLLLLVSERWSSGSVVLVLAIATKLYPVVVVPAALGRCLAAAERRTTRRAAVAGVVTGAVVVLPFALVGPGGLAYSYYVQFKRPLQLESLGASVLLGLDRIGLYDTTVQSGLSKDLAGTAPAIVAVGSSALQLAAVAASVWWFWRGDRDAESLLTASAAAVGAFVAFGKVLSPQYVVWLLPLVPLVARRVWAPAMALTAAAAGLSGLYFPAHYSGIRLVSGWVWVLVLRNAALVVLALLLLESLRRDAARSRMATTATAPEATTRP
jgi:uncharacterized membrane protein